MNLQKDFPECPHCKSRLSSEGERYRFANAKTLSLCREYECGTVCVWSPRAKKWRDWSLSKRCLIQEHLDLQGYVLELHSLLRLAVHRLECPNFRDGLPCEECKELEEVLEIWNGGKS